MAPHMEGANTNKTAYSHKQTEVSIHTRTALIFWVSNTHSPKISQYLIQGKARGKAQVIIMSVFNSSVTGGCGFSVSTAHVNKQAELFKRLAHTCWLPSLAQIQSCWDNRRKNCFLSRCKRCKRRLSQTGILLHKKCLTYVTQCRNLLNQRDVATCCLQKAVAVSVRDARTALWWAWPASLRMYGVSSIS